MFDMNDAEPQKTGELIPDGTFAKVTMSIRPGGIDGQSEIDQALLKAPKERYQASKRYGMVCSLPGKQLLRRAGIRD